MREVARGDKPCLRKSTDRKAQIRKAFVQFSGLVSALRSVDFLRQGLSPRATSRTISFSISNSFWYYTFILTDLRRRWAFTMSWNINVFLHSNSVSIVVLFSHQARRHSAHPHRYTFRPRFQPGEATFSPCPQSAPVMKAIKRRARRTSLCHI